MEVSDEIVERSCWTSGPRPPGSARCTATRRFTPLTAMMGLRTPPSAGRSHRRRNCLMEKEAQAEYAELLRRLYEAISSLPPTQARRVHARYMLGMKVKDIAAMEGITPSQAGKSIHAALRRLRRYLSPEMDKRPMKTINLKKILLPDLQEGHLCGSAGRGRRHCGGKPRRERQ